MFSACSPKHPLLALQNGACSPRSLVEMPSSTLQAFKYCFTYNNPDMNHINDIFASFAPESIQIAFAQYEKVSTLHLQGYFHLKKRMRISELVKKMSNRLHYTIAKGSVNENWTYCHKEDSRVLSMERIYYPSKAVCETFIHLGVGVNGSKRKIEECLERLDNDEIPYDDLNYVKYYNTIHTIRADIESKRLKTDIKDSSYVFKPWQQLLCLLLKKQTDRQIYFVYDIHGNVGKTWLAKWLISNQNFLFVEGKTGNHDLGPLILKHRPNGIVYNIPRSCRKDDGELMVSYSSLESIKDGLMFTTKYQGFSGLIGSKLLLVLANQPPDKNQLSLDRFKVFYVHQNSLFVDRNFTND